jgi:hypothetical protein
MRHWLCPSSNAGPAPQPHLGAQASVWGPPRAVAPRHTVRAGEGAGGERDLLDLLVEARVVGGIGFVDIREGKRPHALTARIECDQLPLERAGDEPDDEVAAVGIQPGRPGMDRDVDADALRHPSFETFDARIDHAVDQPVVPPAAAARRQVKRARRELGRKTRRLLRFTVHNELQAHVVSLGRPPEVGEGALLALTFGDDLDTSGGGHLFIELGDIDQPLDRRRGAPLSRRAQGARRLEPSRAHHEQRHREQRCGHGALEAPPPQDRVWEDVRLTNLIRLVSQQRPEVSFDVVHRLATFICSRRDSTARFVSDFTAPTEQPSTSAACRSERSS